MGVTSSKLEKALSSFPGVCLLISLVYSASKHLSTLVSAASHAAGACLRASAPFSSHTLKHVACTGRSFPALCKHCHGEDKDLQGLQTVTCTCRLGGATVAECPQCALRH